MFVSTMMAMIAASEPFAATLPADRTRTRVPLHVAKSFTLDDWQQLPEDTARLLWAEWRIMLHVDRAAREARQAERELNATLRKYGKDTPPDPVEPTLPYWRRSWKMEMEPKRDR